MLKLVPERQAYRGIAQTFPVVAQLIITKNVAILLLDSLIIQMQDRFSNEDRHARHSLYLVPSTIVNNTLELSEATEGMLFWENPLGMSCEDGKLCGSQQRRNLAMFY